MRPKGIAAFILSVLIMLSLFGCGKSKEGSPDDNSLNSFDAAETAKYTPLNYDNMKAMWLSQFDLAEIYCENGAQRPKADFEEKIAVILENIKNLGFNTVFVQVRPYGDSFYPSSLYPVSSFAAGKFGGALSYDPFAIIVKKAHALDLSVHAWINPMRAMKETEMEDVPNIYKIKKWYNEQSDRLVSVEGRYYLNPAYGEVRQLIIDGAAELARLYEIDGIHMDDYFYPTVSETFDKIAYADYVKNNAGVSLGDFRRGTLNTLVSGIYSAVKAENEKLLFGISPAGDIEKVFSEYYADVYTWCQKSGYIDYICPQVYFGLEHEFFEFKSVCETWQSIVKADSVKLLIGMTVGKAKEKVDPYAGKGKDEWKNNTDVLKRCLEATKSLQKCTGVAYFSYQYFYSPLPNIPDPDTKREVDNFIPILKEIKW